MWVSHHRLCKDPCGFPTSPMIKMCVLFRPWWYCYRAGETYFGCQSKFAFSTRIKWITHKCALKLTSSDFSMRSSGQSRNFLPITMPALLMRIETSPTSFLTWIGWEECRHQTGTSVYDLFPNIYIVLIRTSGWMDPTCSSQSPHCSKRSLSPTLHFLLSSTNGNTMTPLSSSTLSSPYTCV